jgi:hypothetical protein
MGKFPYTQEMQIKTSPHLFFSTIALFLIPSCATIVSGTSQAVTIDSNVPGADVMIEGNLVGVTPYSGKIKRQREAIAIVSADGHVSQPIALTSSYNPVAILSILWDWSLTDFLTGAIWEYAPNSYYVNLKQAGTADASFKNESSLKAFAMTYYPELMIDLAAGGGPRLSSLRAEFVPYISEAQLLTEIKRLDTESAVRFGEELAAFIVATD